MPAKLSWTPPPSQSSRSFLNLDVMGNFRHLDGVPTAAALRRDREKLLYMLTAAHGGGGSDSDYSDSVDDDEDGINEEREAYRSHACRRSPSPKGRHHYNGNQHSDHGKPVAAPLVGVWGKAIQRRSSGSRASSAASHDEGGSGGRPVSTSPPSPPAEWRGVTVSPLSPTPPLRGNNNATNGDAFSRDRRRRGVQSRSPIRGGGGTDRRAQVDARSFHQLTASSRLRSKSREVRRSLPVTTATAANSHTTNPYRRQQQQQQQPTTSAAAASMNDSKHSNGNGSRVVDNDSGTASVGHARHWCVRELWRVDGAVERLRARPWGQSLRRGSGSGGGGDPAVAIRELTVLRRRLLSSLQAIDDGDGRDGDGGGGGLELEGPAGRQAPSCWDSMILSPPRPRSTFQSSRVGSRLVTPERTARTDRGSGGGGGGATTVAASLSTRMIPRVYTGQPRNNTNSSSSSRFYHHDSYVGDADRGPWQSSLSFEGTTTPNRSVAAVGGANAKRPVAWDAYRDRTTTATVGVTARHPREREQPPQLDARRIAARYLTHAQHRREELERHQQQQQREREAEEDREREREAHRKAAANASAHRHQQQQRHRTRTGESTPRAQSTLSAPSVLLATSPPSPLPVRPPPSAAVAAASRPSHQSQYHQQQQQQHHRDVSGGGAGSDRLEWIEGRRLRSYRSPPPRPSAPPQQRRHTVTPHSHTAPPLSTSPSLSPSYPQAEEEVAFNHRGPYNRLQSPSVSRRVAPNAHGSNAERSQYHHTSINNSDGGGGSPGWPVFPEWDSFSQERDGRHHSSVSPVRAAAAAAAAPVTSPAPPPQQLTMAAASANGGGGGGGFTLRDAAVAANSGSGTGRGILGTLWSSAPSRSSAAAVEASASASAPAAADSGAVSGLYSLRDVAAGLSRPHYT